jgi:hypothetical protein
VCTAGRVARRQRDRSRRLAELAAGGDRDSRRSTRLRVWRCGASARDPRGRVRRPASVRAADQIRVAQATLALHNVWPLLVRRRSRHRDGEVRRGCRTRPVGIAVATTIRSGESGVDSRSRPSDSPSIPTNDWSACCAQAPPNSLTSGLLRSSATSLMSRCPSRSAASDGPSRSGLHRSPHGTGHTSRTDPPRRVNNLAKRIKRVAFGLVNFRHHRIRCLHYAGKPDWALLNTIRP